MVKKKDKRQEEFEDTKGVIRSHQSKKDRQHNGKKKKDKKTRSVWRYQRGNQKSSIESEGLTMQWSKENDNSTNNDLQNITQKTKDRATRIPLKCGGCFVICS